MMVTVPTSRFTETSTLSFGEAAIAEPRVGPGAVVWHASGPPPPAPPLPTVLLAVVELLVVVDAPPAPAPVLDVVVVAAPPPPALDELAPPPPAAALDELDELDEWLELEWLELDAWLELALLELIDDVEPPCPPAPPEPVLVSLLLPQPCAPAATAIPIAAAASFNPEAAPNFVPIPSSFQPPSERQHRKLSECARIASAFVRMVVIAARYGFESE